MARVDRGSARDLQSSRTWHAIRSVIRSHIQSVIHLPTQHDRFVWVGVNQQICQRPCAIGIKHLPGSVSIHGS